MSCGQNLEHMGVKPVVFRVRCADSALTIMGQFCVRGKVECHMARWIS